MQTYVILRRGAWDSEEELDAAAGLSTQVADEDMDGRVRWIRSTASVQKALGHLTPRGVAGG